MPISQEANVHAGRIRVLGDAAQFQEEVTPAAAQVLQQ
jgi:hypothetical protein